MNPFDDLLAGRPLTRAGFLTLLQGRKQESVRLRQEAGARARAVFGSKVYLRALLEISSYCKRNCYYCGLRCDNAQARRYRLTKDEILSRAKFAYDLGFRTVVLQGGEDPALTDAFLTDLLSELRPLVPDAAITLSLGERSPSSYEALYAAGARRYLLRHETRDPEHYQRLHPKAQRIESRLECLRTLKTIGYQTGAGMMVGSPGQTLAHLALDLAFLQELRPEMVGIGPFIAHPQTPLADYANGSLDLTLDLIAITRLLLPYALIPSTTAVATLDEAARFSALQAGANVLMPNASYEEHKADYNIYPGKKAQALEGTDSLEALEAALTRIGVHSSMERGDYHDHV
ncbi:[FeFe]-hydrogenase maturation protein HydE [Clostridiaceae bacterium JG1575]|nr:[FeFe]-hydrogenase maturation protein HydE [Clostridiaceae bacterium JG1575]